MDQALKEKIRNVDGWLTDREGQALYTLATRCTGRGEIVEIGSWKGKSTILLSLGSRSNAGKPIHAVDPHIGSPEHNKKEKVWTFETFKTNIANAGVQDMVRPIVQTSEAAAQTFSQPVELVFIDGAHEYEAVKLDFDLWFPKVVDGGVMAFHDTIGWQGPKQVVQDLVYRSTRFKNVRFADSLTYATKVSHNTLTDRLRNRYMLLLKNITEFATCKLRLPKWLKRIGKKAITTLSGS